MAFYLSPLVDVQEIDLSTTIPAVATSIGVIILRNTQKGAEMQKTLVTSEEELIRAFGPPSNEPSCFKDILTASGYLKYGNKLYCTRVLPSDATFAGLKIDSGAISASPFLSAGGTEITLEDIGDPTDPQYGDMSRFHEEVEVNDGAAYWLCADSRGEWAHNIRVGIVNKTDVDLINNNYTTADAEVSVLSGWYPWYTDAEGDLTLRDNWNPLSGGTLVASDAVIQEVLESDITLQEDTEGLVIVQYREHEFDDWDTVEIHRLSTVEGVLNENGYPMFMETYINEMSRYIKATMNAIYVGDDWIGSFPTFQVMGGGFSGTVAGGVGKDTSGIDYSALRDALDVYANPEEIDVTIILDGDKPRNFKRYAVQFCETRKDCMAILDCEYEHVVDNRGNETVDLVDWRRDPNNTGNGLNENTSYAAVYGNWLEVYDRYNNRYRWLPPSGHVGGIYAHTDNVNDPWWAPAGLNRAILTGVRRLAWNPALGHRDLLYKNGINPIVSFAGQGKVIWGQKTMLDKPSSFNRVNVRRLFIVLEKAISTAAKYFLFEPNDEITRLQLKNMIEPFLKDVQSRRGIYDYQVICDETNNTPERIDRNELWCTILIKATRVAEFIVLQFVSLKTGASFEEAAAQVNPKV